MKNRELRFRVFENTHSSSTQSLKSYNGKQWGYETDPAVSGDTGLLRWAPGRRRLLITFTAVFVGFLILFGRLAYLQIAKGATLRVMAEENRIRITPLKAARGVMYDRHGTLLVQNVPNLILEIIPGDLPDDQQLSDLAATLSKVLGEPYDNLASELRDKQKRSFRAIPFRDRLDYTTGMKLRLLEQNLPGVHLGVSATREYLAGPAFSHILGYTGNISAEELANSDPSLHYLMIDEIGKTGLERSYEKLLRGTDGQQQVEVNAVGKEQRVIAAEAPILGKDIQLSILSTLQQAAQNTLDATVRRLRMGGAAAIVLDVHSGEILALASSPTFDNNLFVKHEESKQYDSLLKDERNPLFNRAIAGQYPPGSTIKPLLAAAGLEENVISEGTTVNSTGGISIGQWTFPDWKAGGHGSTNVRKAIAWSVNTFFYTLAGGTDTFTGLGLDRMRDYLHRFGLGTKIGVDLPGEAGGFLPTREWKEETKKEKWYIGDTYHLAIGQGDILVTPLQMAAATSAIANGGKLYQPHLVTSIGNGVQRSVVHPVIKNEHFIQPANLKVVREGMRQAVTEGSASAVQAGIPVEVAAKTGTAQFGADEATHSWFTAFAPYENPQVAVAVVVEGGGEGSSTALPIARDLLFNYFQP